MFYWFRLPFHANLLTNMRFDIITIFPEVVGPYAQASILGKAQEKNLIDIKAHDLRRYSKDRHRKVDDSPYGGGAGMVMTVQPFDDAVRDLRLKKKWFNKKTPTTRVIMTAASGKCFTQADARRLSEYDQIIFLCGRYEGIDERVELGVADEALSIGDFVLTGGELPALVMSDAVARLIPGVLGNSATLSDESHDEEGRLEYPQYTKPERYLIKATKGGKVSEDIELTVPEVLLSGNHAVIEKWREQARKST